MVFVSQTLLLQFPGGAFRGVGECHTDLSEVFPDLIGELVVLLSPQPLPDAGQHADELLSQGSSVRGSPLEEADGVQQSTVGFGCNKENSLVGRARYVLVDGP